MPEAEEGENMMEGEEDMIVDFKHFQKQHCRKCGIVCDWEWDVEVESIGHCSKGYAQEFLPYNEEN